jgi:hypothetical protein
MGRSSTTIFAADVSKLSNHYDFTFPTGNNCPATMAVMQIISWTKQVRIISSGRKTIRLLEIPEVQGCTISHHRSIGPIGKEGMHLVGSLEHNDGSVVHVVSVMVDTHGHVRKRLQFPHISVRWQTNILWWLPCIVFRTVLLSRSESDISVLLILLQRASI